jgi:hypothetical protein
MSFLSLELLPQLLQCLETQIEILGCPNSLKWRLLIHGAVAHALLLIGYNNYL